MRGRPARGGRVLWGALALAGACRVDDRTITTIPDPIVIDTFEDLDVVPLDPRFNAWTHSAFNTGPEMRSFGPASPGFASHGCLQIAWQISDVPDGAPNYAGLLVRTQALGSIDLRPYARISLAARYENTGTCRSSRQVGVFFLCSELDSMFSAVAPLSATWTASSLPFAAFTEVAYLAKGTKLEDCLRVVDEIQISPISELGDGECGSGTLQFDDVVISAEAGVGTPDAGAAEAGDGGAGDAPPAACSGTTPVTPLIFGSSSSPLTPTPYTFSAPELVPPTVSVVTAPGTGVQAVHVTANPGAGTDPMASFTGFGFGFGNPTCVDASAFTGVRLAIDGDLGTCTLTLALITSEDNWVGYGPVGRCTAGADLCLAPQSGPLSVATRVVPFSALGGGTPVPGIDPAALNGVQWTLTVPTDGVTAPCVADFTISDVAFVAEPDAGTRQ